MEHIIENQMDLEEKGYIARNKFSEAIMVLRASFDENTSPQVYDAIRLIQDGIDMINAELEEKKMKSINS